MGIETKKKSKVLKKIILPAKSESRFIQKYFNSKRVQIFLVRLVFFLFFINCIIITIRTVRFERERLIYKYSVQKLSVGGYSPQFGNFFSISSHRCPVMSVDFRCK